MQPPKSYSIGGQRSSRAAYRQARRRPARLQGSLMRAHSSLNRSRSPSRGRKRARNADHARDIAELEHLSRQRAPPEPAPAPPPAPAPEQTPAYPLVTPGVSEQDVVMNEEEQDALSIGAPGMRSPSYMERLNTQT
ncbi:UNVERIFIED_CONTAM: hypothetical protein FKN15_018374 [Acipenser sinensis]